MQVCASQEIASSSVIGSLRCGCWLRSCQPPSAPDLEPPAKSHLCVSKSTFSHVPALTSCNELVCFITEGRCRTLQRAMFHLKAMNRLNGAHETFES